MPVIVNVAGESIEDYVEVCRRLDGQPGVAGIELNISCPNVGAGGLQFALDPGAAGELTAAVRRGHRPTADGQAIARGHGHPSDRQAHRGRRRRCDQRVQHVARHGHRQGAAQGTARATSTADLSGPALKPVALRVVYEVAQVVKIPIVAIGGIGSLDDVLDFMFAGAVAVQVGTAVFADPVLPLRLADELAAWCAAHGYSSHLEIVGAALPERRRKPSMKGVEYRP